MTPKKYNEHATGMVCGPRSNIEGSYKPNKGGSLLSDTPLAWMSTQALQAKLALETHLEDTFIRTRRQHWIIPDAAFIPPKVNTTDQLITIKAVY